MDKIIRKVLIVIFWLLVLTGLTCLTAVVISHVIEHALSIIALMILLPLDLVIVIVFLAYLEDIFESEDQC